MIRIGLILIILAIAGCEVQDGQVITPSCPATCDDADECTFDYCSQETGFICVHDTINNCCGNSICEKPENSTTCTADCPVCPTGNCLVSYYDYDAQQCVVEGAPTCCGNGVCEEGESFEECPEDCQETEPVETAEPVICEPTEDVCMVNIRDEMTNTCILKPIVPCCGNGICDRGEDCESCDDCECPQEKGTDLSDFPDFLSDGTLIVVGDEATSMDSLTAAFLTTSLAAKGIDTDSDLYSLFEESELKTKDMIVLGDPCDNTLWKNYQGVECFEDFFEPGQAMVKLVFDKGREIVFVGGREPEDTRSAAEILLEGSLDGLEVYLG